MWLFKLTRINKRDHSVQGLTTHVRLAAAAKDRAHLQPGSRAGREASNPSLSRPVLTQSPLPTGCKGSSPRKPSSLHPPHSPHWLGRRAPPPPSVFSGLPRQLPSVTECVTAGNYLPAHHPVGSQHCPALGQPTVGPNSCSGAERGKGLCRGSGSEEGQRDGWFSCLVWGHCCHALPLWTQLETSSGGPGGAEETATTPFLAANWPHQL